MVKKITLLMMAGVLAVPAGVGQTFSPVLTRAGHSHYSVPAMFSKDGDPKMVIISDDDEETSCALSVYNKNLEKVAAIDIVYPAQNVSSYDALSHRILEYTGVKDEWIEGEMSYDNMLSIVENDFYGKFVMVERNGRQIYYPAPTTSDESFNYDAYYMVWEVGPVYPRYCFAYLPNEGDPNVGTFFRIQLNDESYRMTGEWSEPVRVDERDNSYYPFERLYLTDFNTNCDDAFSMVVTQTLFNDDAAYEYVAPVRETVLSYVEETDYKRLYHYEAEVTSLNICGESGSVLSTLQAPDGHTIEDVNVVVIGDMKYLGVESVSRSDAYDYEYYITYYKINDGSGITQATAPMRVSVTPSVIRHNESVNVRIDELTGNSRLTVTDAQGRAVFSSPVREAGIHQIPGRVMSRGLNIVSVESDGARVQSSKVIVR